MLLIISISNVAAKPEYDIYHDFKGKVLLIENTIDGCTERIWYDEQGYKLYSEIVQRGHKESYVAAANKCMYEQTTELPQIKNKVILHRYYGSPSGKEVLFYEVRNGGHNWATDSFDSCRVIMEFFEKYTTK